MFVPAEANKFSAYELDIGDKFDTMPIVYSFSSQITIIKHAVVGHISSISADYYGRQIEDTFAQYSTDYAMHQLRQINDTLIQVPEKGTKSHKYLSGVTILMVLQVREL